MAAELEMRVTGLRELGEKLKALPDKLRSRTLRDAVKAGAELVRDAAKAAAPVYTGPVSKGHPPPGTLKKNIICKHARDPAHDETFIVAVRKGKKQTYANSRLNRRMNRAGASYRPDEKAFYWRFVEFGTVKMPAHPFLRPAFEANKEAAARAIKPKLAEGLQQAASR